MSQKFIETGASLVNGAVLLVLALFVSGCSKTIDWTEEVAFSNGDRLIVERSTKHVPGGAELSIGTGWKPALYAIRFEYPPSSGQEIEWRSTKLSPEKDPERPLILDFNEELNGLELITINWMKGFCYEYVRYVRRGNQWMEEPLPREFEARMANLYVAASALEMPDKVDLNEKKKVMADFTYRKRLKQVGPTQRACGA